MPLATLGWWEAVGMAFAINPNIVALCKAILWKTKPFLIIGHTTG
jgi:hypothetical protein